MPIALVDPPSCGTALRLTLAPEPDALWWRILRRTDANFAGPDDPNATLIVDQCIANGVIDFEGLTNGTTYFYQLYSSLDGVTLQADGGPASGTPAATYTDASADPQEVLYERLQAGLAVEVAAGNLAPGPKSNGIIPVFLAPYATPDQIVFPNVVLFVEQTDSTHRSIGEQTSFDRPDYMGNVVETEGWLAPYTIAIVGTALNPRERIALRKSLRRIIQANMPIFEAAGMAEIGFSQSDAENFRSDSAPMFMTNGKFTCAAPASISETAPASQPAIISATEFYG